MVGGPSALERAEWREELDTGAQAYTHIYIYICIITYIYIYIYIYICMVQRCPPPPQWSWVRQVPPPLWFGPVVGLWWFRVGLELV